jgi:hypothetical protein
MASRASSIAPLVRSARAFERLLARLPADVLRAKGIVRFAGRDWHCLFNYTCGRHELTWMKLDGVGQETQRLHRPQPRPPPPADLSDLAACETDDEGKHDNV